MLAIFSLSMAIISPISTYILNPNDIPIEEYNLDTGT